MGKDIERSFDGSPVMKADAPAAELPAEQTAAIESVAPTTPVESGTLEPATPPAPTTEPAAEPAARVDTERSE
jgi:hypothetical protein